MSEDIDITISRFDVAEHLGRESTRIALINDALASGHPGYIASAIGALARSGGLSALERATGIKRQTLNKSLGPDGNPTLRTLMAVLDSLGLEFRVQPKSDPGRRAAAA